MSEDFTGVKAAFDKPTGYRTGDPVKVTISGKAVLTTSTSMNLNLQLSDPVSGQTGTIAATAPFVRVEQDSVVVTGATDDQGHTWVVSADGLSVTTVA